jgi:hypothetical protein
LATAFGIGVVGYAIGDRVVLADDIVSLGRSLRHEMLHVISAKAGHPRALFLDRCGGLVECEERCVAGAGAPPPLDPTAERIEVAALEIRTEVYPTSPATTTDGGYFHIVVRARNAHTRPVVVGFMRPSSSFGLRLARADSIVQVDIPVRDANLPFFRAGEEKRFFFDLLVNAPAPRYQVFPGEYTATGGLGGAWGPSIGFVVAP